MSARDQAAQAVADAENVVANMTRKVDKVLVALADAESSLAAANTELADRQAELAELPEADDAGEGPSATAHDATVVAEEGI